jgi:Na+-driven multidrug efflux pump
MTATIINGGMIPLLEQAFSGSTTNMQKIKVILALAIPAMIENFLQTIVGFIDTLFVAKIGLVSAAGLFGGN